MRYELTDNEWSAIKPMLPNKPRGRNVSMTLKHLVS
jgi:transposase